MEKKKMNVKAFADLYGMTSKEVLKELAAQGFTLIRTATSNIPPEDLELIAAYFDELTGKVKPKEESRSIADDYDDLEETGGKEKIKSSSGAAKGKKRGQDAVLCILFKKVGCQRHQRADHQTMAHNVEKTA